VPKPIPESWPCNLPIGTGYGTSRHIPFWWLDASAARAGEILSLDAEDLNLLKKRARCRRTLATVAVMAGAGGNGLLALQAGQHAPRHYQPLTTSQTRRRACRQGGKRQDQAQLWWSIRETPSASFPSTFPQVVTAPP